MNEDPVKPLPRENYRENALTYGRTPQSPASISPVEIEKWKGRVSPTFKHYIEKQFNEIAERYRQLVDQYELNRLVYESEISFEPVIGYTYHLYGRSNGTRFLSLVGPDESFWDGYIGSYRLNSQYAWEKAE